MNYRRIYNQLIQKRLENPLIKQGDGSVEQHHIIPRCLGGTNDKSNLVNLTCREHFIAHCLLWKMYKSENQYLKAHKMCLALGRLITGNITFISRINYNSRLYKHMKQLSSNHNEKYYYNEDTDELIFIRDNEEIPAGFKRGGRPTSKYISKQKLIERAKCHIGKKYVEGRITICNDNTNEMKMIDPTDAIPDGWRRGVIKRPSKINPNEKYKLYKPLYDEYIKNGFDSERFQQLFNSNVCLHTLIINFEKWIPEYKPKSQKGKFAISNPDTKKVKYVFNENDIPEGWIIGDITSTKQSNLEKSKIVKKYLIEFGYEKCIEKFGFKNQDSVYHFIKRFNPNFHGLRYKKPDPHTSSVGLVEK